MVFGQVVIGPPGSGKTTYCEGMLQFLGSLGRKVAVINLDPANDVLPYQPAADIRDLISLEGAAEQCELGPNGALVYCAEFLEANVDWLLEKLTNLSDTYVLFDLPGQVELYTHHGSVKAVLHALGKANHRLTAVHLVDAHHCADPAKFISVLLVTLSTMVQLEMPQVNLLSKVDLVETYGELAFGLDFYTDVLDPARLLPLLQAREGGSAFSRRHAKLNAAIVELVDDFSLVNFGTLDITDKASVARALKSIDKANGYCFGAAEGVDASVFTCAAGELEWDDDRVGTAEERYMREDDMDELRAPHEGVNRDRAKSEEGQLV
jgi:GTPase SAR1 family protein